MWTPGRMDQVSDLGVTDAHGKPVSQKSLARMAWILLDKTGRLMEQYHGRIPPEAWDRIADLITRKRRLP